MSFKMTTATKKYIVSVELRIKKDIGTFQTQTDDNEAIEKAKSEVNKIIKRLEDCLDIGDEVEIYNYYTELC